MEEIREIFPNPLEIFRKSPVFKGENRGNYDEDLEREIAEKISNHENFNWNCNIYATEELLDKLYPDVDKDKIRIRQIHSIAKGKNMVKKNDS